LNKKRREADVVRCVCRCQRGEYVFAPHAEIDRFLWHAREPFDDAQLTALSNALRAEQLGGRQRRRQRRRARSAQGRRRPADARTRARRLRFVAPQHRLSPHRVQAGHTDAVVPAAVATAASGSPSVPRHAAVVDNLKSQGRSRLASMPVRPQFNMTELAAAGKQADLETERLRLKALAAKSVVELAREKTPPPPPPPLKH
jgi:hypothetical protein